MGKLTVEIEASLARFQADMAKSAQITEQAMGRMGASSDMAKKALASFAGGTVGAIAGMVGMGQAIGAMNVAIARMDELDEMSERLGIGTQTLQEFAYAGKMNGVDLDTMAGAMKKLQVSLFDANTGGKESAAVHKALGVAINDANGNLRSAPEVMGDLAEVFANLNDGSTKTALAIKLFGKSGADMVPFLFAGRDGIKEMTDEANRLGGVMGMFQQAMTKWDAGGSSSATGGIGIMGDVTPSDANGFDVPAGVNPVTQLHEREMVLPKQHADVIRGLAGGAPATLRRRLR